VDNADIPLYWSDEGKTAEVVRCHHDHVAFRETFEEVGGCPYCLHTPRERIAALGAQELRRRGRANHE
jgi:hypothetical protein